MMTIRGCMFAITMVFSLALATQVGTRAATSSGTWRFLASGDSRNCGDVVMPGIAETARKNQAAFYWHLGDLRADFQL